MKTTLTCTCANSEITEPCPIHPSTDDGSSREESGNSEVENNYLPNGTSSDQVVTTFPCSYDKEEGAQLKKVFDETVGLPLEDFWKLFYGEGVEEGTGTVWLIAFLQSVRKAKGKKSFRSVNCQSYNGNYSSF